MPLQLKKYVVLNNSQPVVLTINAQRFASYMFDRNTWMVQEVVYLWKN